VLLDACVARSIAVLGWVEQAAQAVGGSLRLAHGVLGAYPDEPCELRQIRDGLQRHVDTSPPGSGRYSKAVTAVLGLDALMSLGPPQVTIMMPDAQATAITARLTSMEEDARAWRHGLGMRARRLDAGEAVSIGIAVTRGLDFASDDGQALIAYGALTGRPGVEVRTRDVIKLLVDQRLIEEAMGRDGYRFLQEDDLHNLGGPDW
jgi:hypothetical protein